MGEQRLLQRHRPTGGRRRRPGFFRVERPDQLWHMDMTAVWVAEHRWCSTKAWTSEGGPVTVLAMSWDAQRVSL